MPTEASRTCRGGCHRTAKHYFCSICGIYPFHRKRVTPDYYGVNVACLAEFDPAGIPVRATAGAEMN